MNSALKRFFVTTILNECIKGAKDMVMGYAKQLLVELMDWLYIWYGQINPVYLMWNQYDMQATSSVKYLIDILFDQMETG